LDSPTPDVAGGNRAVGWGDQMGVEGGNQTADEADGEGKVAEEIPDSTNSVQHSSPTQT
jgi:hypothetical protein